MTFGELEIGQKFSDNNVQYQKISHDRGDGEGWAISLSSGVKVSFSHTDSVWMSPAA